VPGRRGVTVVGVPFGSFAMVESQTREGKLNINPVRVEMSREPSKPTIYERLGFGSCRTICVTHAWSFHRKHCC